MSAATWAPSPSVFTLGGRRMLSATNLTPDVLAQWEDRFVDEPGIATLLGRTDAVLYRLIDPASHGDFAAVRADRDDPVGIEQLARVGEWLFAQDTLRSFRSCRRLFAWTRANWNQIDGYALAHGTVLERLGLRQVLNLTYWALTENAEEKDQRGLDRQLEAPEGPAADGRPALDAGALDLLQLMQGN